MIKKLRDDSDETKVKQRIAQNTKNKENTIIKKKYNKKHEKCRVTFQLPKEAVNGVTKVTVVGDFNSWDRDATPLKKLRNGAFSATIELPVGRSYRFKYLIDDTTWENDWHADSYEPNSFGSEDSVVHV